jgi:hypothetical protein
VLRKTERYGHKACQGVIGTATRRDPHPEVEGSVTLTWCTLITGCEVLR